MRITSLEKKWTGGNWEVSHWLCDPDDPSSKMRFVHAPGAGTSPQGNPLQVATCCTGDVSDATEEANAHLIAAAPDLVEALELVLMELRFSKSQATFDKATNAACAALARAYGEEQ